MIRSSMMVPDRTVAERWICWIQRGGRHSTPVEVRGHSVFAVFASRTLDVERNVVDDRRTTDCDCYRRLDPCADSAAVAARTAIRNWQRHPL